MLYRGLSFKFWFSVQATIDHHAGITSLGFLIYETIDYLVLGSTNILAE